MDYKAFFSVFVCLVCFGLAGCSSSGSGSSDANDGDSLMDSGVDAGGDDGMDTGADNGADNGMDAGADTPTSCPAGTHNCNNHCVSDDSSETCGDRCSPCEEYDFARSTCVNRHCEFECLPEASLCGDRCVLIAADSSNCGDCGHSCPVGQGCSDGYCIPVCNGKLRFRYSLDIPVTVKPNGLAVLDIDGMLRPELIVSDSESASLLVFTGTSDGWVAPGEAYSIQIDEVSNGLLTGDLDNDGDVDLVTLTADKAQVLLIDPLADEPPIARPAFNIGRGLWDGDVKLADIDGDDVIDMIVMSKSAKKLRWLKGHGDGDFDIPVDLADMDNGIEKFAIGDVLGNAGLEILVVESHALQIFSGDASEYNLVQSIYLGWDSLVVVGQFDGRGKFDAVVLRENENLSLLLGGEAVMTMGPSYDMSAVVPSNIELFAEDITGDGICDVLIGDTFRLHTGILAGVGNGTLAPFNWLLALGAAGPGGLVVADMDGDGDRDILAVKPERRRVEIAEAIGGGDFVNARYFPVYGSYLSMLPGHFNDDQFVDFIAMPKHPESTPVKILLADGTGDFDSISLQLLEGNEEEIDQAAVADLNGDGLDDFLLFDNNSIDSYAPIYVGLNNGDGTFSMAEAGQVGNRLAFLGDLNGDGNVDILLSGGYGIGVRLGDGQGGFVYHEGVGVSSAEHLLVAHTVHDLDGDGKPDLIVSAKKSSDGNPRIYSLLATGDLSFSEAYSTRIVNQPGLELVASADLDANGTLDVAAIVENQNDTLMLQLFFGNGDGTFTKKTENLSSGYISHYGVLASDIDADGMPELVTTLRDMNGTHGVAVLKIDSVSRWYETEQFIPMRYVVDKPVLSDFSDDRLPDLAVFRNMSSWMGAGMLVLPGVCQ